jgi:hypothetical protein
MHPGCGEAEALHRANDSRAAFPEFLSTPYAANTGLSIVLIVATQHRETLKGPS